MHADEKQYHFANKQITSTVSVWIILRLLRSDHKTMDCFWFRHVKQVRIWRLCDAPTVRPYGSTCKARNACVADRNAARQPTSAGDVERASHGSPNLRKLQNIIVTVVDLLTSGLCFPWHALPRCLLSYSWIPGRLRSSFLRLRTATLSHSSGLSLREPFNRVRPCFLGTSYKTRCHHRSIMLCNWGRNWSVTRLQANYCWENS